MECVSSRYGTQLQQTSGRKLAQQIAKRQIVSASLLSSYNRIKCANTLCISSYTVNFHLGLMAERHPHSSYESTRIISKDCHSVARTLNEQKASEKISRVTRNESHLIHLSMFVLSLSLSLSFAFPILQHFTIIIS